MNEAFRTIEISEPRWERDGLHLITVKSRALGRRADVTLWVPDVQKIESILILLHGVYGSHWVWSLKAGVHHTAQALLRAGEIAPVVIAMPSDSLRHDGSAYLTWPGDEDVERWIVDEVPAVAHLAAPALIENSSMAIAGLSMGGYGALRLGAKYAGRFTAISAHSSITDISQMQQFVEDPLEPYLACAPREELSALHWLKQHRAILPPLRFDCGVDDPLLAANRALHHALTLEGIAHDYAEYPGGHEWPYWQQHVAQTLCFADHYARGKTPS